MRFENWGLIDYECALERQLKYSDELYENRRSSTVVFCSHQPIVTLGRRTKTADVGSWEGKTLQVNRGGGATYHGPSQIVGYPILNLKDFDCDLHAHLRSIETAVAGALATVGIAARGRQQENSEATGVWIGDKKIASIGIGVRKWISMHGFALNVEHDTGAFDGIQPCGFKKEVMTSVEEVLGRKTSRSELLAALEVAFHKQFQPAKT